MPSKCPFHNMTGIHQQLWFPDQSSLVTNYRLESGDTLAALLEEWSPKAAAYAGFKLIFGHFRSSHRDAIYQTVIQHALDGTFTQENLFLTLSREFDEFLAKFIQEASSHNLVIDTIRTNHSRDLGSTGKPLEMFMDIINTWITTGASETFNLLEIYHRLCDAQHITPTYKEGVSAIALKLASMHIALFIEIDLLLKKPQHLTHLARIQQNMDSDDHLGDMLLSPFREDAFYLDEHNRLFFNTDALPTEHQFSVATTQGEENRVKCPAFHATRTDANGNTHKNIILDLISIVSEAYAVSRDRK